MKTRKHSATLLFICFICLYFIYLPYLFILFALFTYHATTLKTNIRLSENRLLPAAGYPLVTEVFCSQVFK